MEKPRAMRNMKKQSLWITLSLELVVEVDLTRDFRRTSLERQQWPVVSRVLTIHFKIRLLTIMTAKNLQERAWHTLHPRKVGSMITLRFQASRVKIQLGMDLAVRTTKPTKVIPKEI